MGGFYFFLSSLPFLQFTVKPDISLSSFLDEAAYHTSVAEYEELKAMTADTFGGKKYTCQSAAKFIAFETTLRNRLAVLRAGRMKEDAEKYLKDTSTETTAELAARAAFEESNPLKAEEILYRARFVFLENMESGHFYDFDALALFALKLKVVERFHRFDAEKGKELYQKIQKEIYENEDT
ncbi:MAG: DUF2764 family protein [Spirochaetales bacterium]|nr:DUF2764 family protein [Spirochaetales bacterium]